MQVIKTAVAVLATATALSSTVKAAAVAVEPQYEGPTPSLQSSDSTSPSVSSLTRTAKQTYGPVTVPPMSDNDGMVDLVLNQIAMPCERCLITSMKANLELGTTGKTANARTGQWLHHIVLANNERAGAVCPHQPERFFASGNERTVISFESADGVMSGYRLDKSPSIGLMAELMNETEKPADVVITITFEYLLLDEVVAKDTNTNPAVARIVTPVWLDVGDVDGRCVRSKIPNIAHTAFAIPSRPWDSTIAGTIAFSGGHVHDGGTGIDLYIDGEIACVSNATYGGDPAFADPPGGGMTGMAGMAGTGGMDGMADMNDVQNMPGKGGMADPRMDHISKMDVCRNFGPLKTGQTLRVTARYDTAAHMPMVRDDGSLEPIMGIVLLYVASEPVAAASLTEP